MPPNPHRRFHILAVFTVAVGVLLVWWGAAVTTEDVGLAVPDWPLCYGRINPEGWWQVPALLLEHGHRWIAATVGLLVLAMYIWQWAAHKGSLLELCGLIICSAGLIFLAHKQSLIIASAVAIMGLLWFLLSWVARRWPPLRTFTVLALMLVVAQAAFGGLRVLQMSDPFGIVHGCLGQLFFCLLLLLALLSSRTWGRGRRLFADRSRLAARWLSLLLLAMVFGQLVLGAILRHTQRDHLAASDIITTAGYLIPPSSPADVFMLFAHKTWGWVVAIAAVLVSRPSQAWVESLPGLRLIPNLLLGLPIVQIGLGIAVVLTGKSFWFTNFHVLNGLALLAASFLLMANVWGGARGLVTAASRGDGAATGDDAAADKAEAVS